MNTNGGMDNERNYEAIYTLPAHAGFISNIGRTGAGTAEYYGAYTTAGCENRRT